MCVCKMNRIDGKEEEVGCESEYRITVNMSNFQFENAGSIPATCKLISMGIGIGAESKCCY